ncbi:MAG: O-antigen ligase family protein [Caldilineaceae bacterium]
MGKGAWQSVSRLGCGLLLLTLPIAFNPYALLPFEPVKATLLRWGVGLVALLVTAVALGPQGHRDLRTVQDKAPTPKRFQLWLPVIVVFGYGALLGVATGASTNVAQSLWGLSDRHGAVTTWALLLYFGLLYTSLTTVAQIEQQLLLALLAGVTVSSYGIAQFAGYDPFAWQSDSISSVHATLGRSNFLGAFLAVILPISVYLLARVLAVPSAHRRLFPALAAIVLLLPQMATLLFTQARAGWLAFGVGTTVAVSGFWWVQGRRQLWQLALSLCACWLLGYLLFVWFNQSPTSPAYQPVIVSSGASFAAQRDASIVHRWLIWRSTLTLLPGHWWWGYGPEMFVTVFQARFPAGTLYTGADAIVDDPHNLWLEQLMAVGLGGTLLFAALLAWFYSALLGMIGSAANRKSKQLAVTLLAAMSAYLTQAQFNPDVVTLSLLCWLLLACGFALRYGVVTS